MSLCNSTTSLAVRIILKIFRSSAKTKTFILCSQTGFVLTMELVGASKRTACGISFQAAFAGGIMLVAAWGAIIPDRKWRRGCGKWLQVIYGLHSCLLLFHYWLMDESPRWLWAQGRREEAVKIVAKGVKWNKNGIPLDEQYYLSKAKYMSTNT
ncbi:organic cation transporter protein-like [Sitodiplosis mosellana]|uniref:organic cation transporter protein-like n=1 Tax=Sitodiplosis mosellana TaxID=263140 RepID=UPI002444C7F4|nr:organic cation transporter protein-like [Sitodiplosis mosellana]